MKKIEGQEARKLSTFSIVDYSLKQSKMSSNLVVQMTEMQLKNMIDQSIRDALRGVAESKMDLAIPSAPKQKKSAKKDPDAPKKEPSDWIHFTSHVRSALESQVEEGKKPHPRAVTQVASSLKEKGFQGKWDSLQKKMVDSASSAQIVEAYKAWLANPPAVSKMVAQGKDKSSKKSSVAGSVEASPVAPEPKAKKARKTKKDMTPEELAERERKSKAKKATAAVPPPVAAPVADDDVMDFEPFDPWHYEDYNKIKGLKLKKDDRGYVFTQDMEWYGLMRANGKIDDEEPAPEDLKLLKNMRGDVITGEMSWYGRMGADGKIDRDAPKPEDLDI